MPSRRTFVLGLFQRPGKPILNPADFRPYFEEFNSIPTPGVESLISDADSFAWVIDQFPKFACPDPQFQRTWYYRCWLLRKHLRKTPAGYIFTEFLRPVRHATDHNAVSCAVGHHIAEARWLRDPQYLDSYLRFWLASGDNGGLHHHYHQFSNWTAHALYQRYLVDQRAQALLALYEALQLDYAAWEQERLLPSGLFWQYDVRDGMEESISGGRRVRNIRPTINSYMHGNATALARIAELAGDRARVQTFAAKARRLRELILRNLWNPASRFFETRLESGSLAGVREQIGFTPWFVELPPARGPHHEAWSQLTDPQGFRAPFGPTTAEQRHPGFTIAESGDDCQWNGPSWPFSTTITLTALANVLAQGHPTPLTSQDYFDTLLGYARSHRLRLEDGREVAFLDENLNPFTGEWHARARKLKKGTFYGRGDHYNHSAFCDLVITGLCGLRPQPGSQVEIRPLLPHGTWDWFCLEQVPYHGRQITILWDREGERFGRGPGLQLFVDGQQIAQTRTLKPLRAQLH